MGFFNFFSSHKETPKQPQQSGTQLQMPMFANLSQTQKFAMLSMLASLASAPTDVEKSAMAKKMMLTDAAMIGLTEDMMINYMQTHARPNFQSVISTLKTITDTGVMEWLLYSCFGIVSVTQNEKYFNIFLDWWQQLGYEPEDVSNVVKKVEAICNKIRGLNSL